MVNQPVFHPAKRRKLWLAGARVASGSFQFPPGRGSQQSDDDRVRWMDDWNVGIAHRDAEDRS